MRISFAAAAVEKNGARRKEIMQFNDAFAQVIRVRSNAAAIKQAERETCPET
jgi:hypothetical protein